MSNKELNVCWHFIHFPSFKSTLLKEYIILLISFIHLFFPSELEAKEACEWLRAAGFPQYAQLYEGNPELIPQKSTHPSISTLLSVSFICPLALLLCVMQCYFAIFFSSGFPSYHPFRKVQRYSLPLCLCLCPWLNGWKRSSAESIGIILFQA